MPNHQVTRPIQIPPPFDVLKGWEEKTTAPYIKGFNMGEIRVILEWWPKRGYHIIYTGKERYPTWAEMSTFRYLMLDEKKHQMVMVMPPFSAFTSNDTTLEVWEMGMSKKPDFEKPADYKEVIEDLKIQLEVHRA